MSLLGTLPRKFAEWIGWSPNGSGLFRAGRPASQAQSSESRDVGTAVELFSRLAEITSAVSTEVKQHGGNIQSVNDELASIQQGDAAAVAAAVCKLLVMNQQTQQRLAHAELRLQAQQRQLADVATAAKTDALTGLANRRGLDEELATALAKFQHRGRPAAVLMLDIDHFKRFNDHHGHLAGDQALKRLADVLLSHARDADAVARFGGEEFAVVFHGAMAASVVQRAETMRQAIGQATILVDGMELRITASGGLAEFTTGETIEATLKRADEALYAAKLDGRDCCYIHSGEHLDRVGQHNPQPGALAALAASAADPLKVSQPGLAGPAAALGVSSASSGAPKAPGVEMAADQFADSTFIGQIARRVAEWRRGGTTFSLVLLRVTFLAGSRNEPTEEARRTALRIVFQSARASLRDMDLVTRWNDDGLAILLPGSLVTDAAGVANRLRATIEKHDMPDPHGGLKLTLCAGVAEVIEGNDAQRVLRRAWLALDSATENPASETGTGRVFLHDGLRPAPV